MQFSDMNYRKKVTICNKIFCQHEGVNNTLLNQYFKQDEHKAVRDFIQKYHDEIVRKKSEFLNLPESKMIELIQKYQLHVDVNNNAMITYRFWEEDQDEIRRIVRQIVIKYPERLVDVPVPGVVPVPGIVDVPSVVNVPGVGVVDVKHIDLIQNLFWIEGQHKIRQTLLYKQHVENFLNN